MLHCTRVLAARVDRAEIEFCAAAATAAAPRGAAVLEAGGAMAVYALSGSPLNKVLGLGLSGEAADADLDAIEDFYAERGSPVQIELCPMADPTLPARLSRRGYVLQAFEHELARRAPTRPIALPADVRVGPIAADDNAVWVDVVAAGFAASEGSREEPDAETTTMIAAVMRSFIHPSVTRYLAWVDGQPAGGGASFLADRVLGIFGTATAAAYRRRGVQTAIVAAAMNDRPGEFDLAIASTEPGSASQRTFERHGFALLYSRAILVQGDP